MTKLPPAILLLVLVSVSALAQNPSYSMDNFDFQNGVRIHQAPPKAPTLPSKLSPAARSRATRKSEAVNANEVLSPSLSSSALVQPTLMSTSPMADLSSLRGFTTGNSQVDGYLIDSG